MLELRDLVKHYRLGDAEPIRAVDGVSLTVQPGEFVALYGPSGSGKTTLLELIAGLREPDSGQVCIAGRDIWEMKEAERDDYRLHKLGLIAQIQNLAPGTKAIANATMKLNFTANPKAINHMLPLFVRLGLEERLQHRTEQLSMGERQRVMIAQALSTDPELVLADEPTAMLDRERTFSVLALLGELCQERDLALLLATHDPQAVGFADRAYELRDGRLGPYSPPDLSAVPGRDQESS